MPDFFIILAIAYFIGTIPLGLIIKSKAKINILNEGEEKIGVMKIRRLLGVEWATLLLLGYFLKGYLGLWLAGLLWGNNFIYLTAALMIILGQVKSHFSNELGGVMPIFLGIVYFWDFNLGGVLGATWVSFYILLKNVNLTNFLILIFSPLILVSLKIDPALIIFSFATALFIIHYHISISKARFGERGN